MLSGEERALLAVPALTCLNGPGCTLLRATPRLEAPLRELRVDFRALGFRVQGFWGFGMAH